MKASMKINQVDKTEEIVAITLEKIIEIERKDEFAFDAPEGKKVKVKCHGTSVSGSKILCLEILNNNVIKTIATYSPESGEKFDYLIAHLNEKNRWDKALIDAYKTNDYFPCPFGKGSETPKTHHWSEYAGTRIDACLSDVDTDVDKVTAKLASALTAKKDAINDVLGKKDYAPNLRKVDAVHFNDPDPKRILFNYIDFAEYKLDRALNKYAVLEDALSLAHDDTSCTMNKDALAILKREIDAVKIKHDRLEELKKIVTNTKFDYAPEEYVIIHPDLNLDNILLNKEKIVEKEKDYEISFIDGFLREGQTLQDHYGPKQMYYFILEKRREWLTTENATRETNAKLSLMLENLGKILKNDYKIDVEKRDYVIKDVIDAYFDSFLIKKSAERKYDKFFGKLERNTKTSQQQTLTVNTKNEEVPYDAEHTLSG
jgi:hypothetical protein